MREKKKEQDRIYSFSWNPLKEVIGTNNFAKKTGINNPARGYDTRKKHYAGYIAKFLFKRKFAFIDLQKCFLILYLL